MNPWYLKTKYGIYLTLAYEAFNIMGAAERYGASASVYANGQQPNSVDQVADAFDVPRLVQDCVDMKLEYVNLTLYHAHCYTLAPFQTLDRWLPGHTAKRDVIRELLDELHKHDIRLQLYIHSTIGDSATDEERLALGYEESADHYLKWNDFINEFFGEIAERYPDMDSFYIDMVFDRPFVEMIDQQRLLRTMKRVNPEVVITANGESNLLAAYGSRENHNLYSVSTQSAMLVSPTWWACVPYNFTHTIPGFKAVRQSTESLYRQLVMNVGSNTDGGGIAFACGLYCDGGFEPGVKETMVELGNLIEPVAASIKQTYPSQSYVTPSGIYIHELPYGISATQSPDGKYEYIHVLTPPQGNVLTLPAPLDGAQFSHPVVLNSEHSVQLKQDASGIQLTLDGTWHALDTVIRLRADRPSLCERPAAALASSHITARCDNSVSGYPANAVLDGCPDSLWMSLPTDENPFPALTLELDQEYEITGLHVLPRQDGQGFMEMRSHLCMYSVYTSLDGENFRAVATGELMRSMDNKAITFHPVRARYVKLISVTDWVEFLRPVEERSPVAVAEIALDTVVTEN